MRKRCALVPLIVVSMSVGTLTGCTEFLSWFGMGGTVAKPEISPDGGTFFSVQSVNVILTSDTNGATIYYTDDGSTPTALSRQYTGPIALAFPGEQTINAIAVKDGMSNSDVATASYRAISWDEFGSAGAGVACFENPCGIALDGGNAIYVADTNNDRIVKISDLNGSGWATCESGAMGGVGSFLYPHDVSVYSGAYTTIHVADTNNSRLVKMDNMYGTQSESYGTYGINADYPSFFANPSGVVVDASGRIYVTDSLNSRIVRINDMTGAGWVEYPVEAMPTGIAVDANGRIYFAEWSTAGICRIVRIDDMSGAGRVTCGGPGSGAGGFEDPADLALDSNAAVYVADTGNNRIVRLRLP